MGEASGVTFETQQQALTAQIAKVTEEIQTVSKELQKQRVAEVRRSQQDDLGLPGEALGRVIN